MVLCGEPPQALSEAACHEEPTAGLGDLSLSGRHNCDTALPNTTVALGASSRMLDAPVRHSVMAPSPFDIPALGHGWVEGAVRPAASPPALSAFHVTLRI